MQGAEFAATDLVHKRIPFGRDDLSGRILVAGETGSGEQFFEERDYFSHLKKGKKGQIMMLSRFQLAPVGWMSVEVEVGVKVNVVVGVDVALGVNVEVRVQVDV